MLLLLLLLLLLLVSLSATSKGIPNNRKRPRVTAQLRYLSRPTRVFRLMTQVDPADTVATNDKRRWLAVLAVLVLYVWLVRFSPPQQTTGNPSPTCTACRIVASHSSWMVIPSIQYGEAGSSAASLSVMRLPCCAGLQARADHLNQFCTSRIFFI